jgi:hypothetical protein
MSAGDHHSEYLAAAVAALTPEGHRRVDELLDQLSDAVAGRESLVAFAKARRAEADLGRVAAGDVDSPHARFTSQEVDALIAGFMSIRDQEPLDDVSNWANAVAALLEDARPLGRTSLSRGY